MRALLLSTVALATLAGSAFAADLPSRKEAPVYVAPPPAFSWTGFYVGADIGGAFASTSLTDTVLGLTSHSLDTSGVMGGGYIGYNYQLNQNFVLGVEGDFQGTSASANYGWNVAPPPINVAVLPSTNYSAKTSLDWLAAINGRVGVSYDRALFYAIGGAAWAGTSSSLTAVDSTGLFLWSGSKSDTLSGFDVGAGVEYAFTPNWVGRVEYRYYDFGNYNLIPVGQVTPFRLDTSVNSVRVGLAYLFSSPAPVVAKY
jgi:outer membrane immunogenic protein